MSIGEKLKNLRAHKKVNQKNVADYLGIDRTTYTKYETDTSEPDLEMIRRLANYYQIGIDYLISEDQIADFEVSYGQSTGEGIQYPYLFRHLEAFLKATYPNLQSPAFQMELREKINRALDEIFKK